MSSRWRWATAVAVTTLVLATPASRAAAAVGPTTKLAVTLSSSSAQVGELAGMNVFARDSQNNPTPGYRGTVHFTSTDPSAILPLDHAFNAGDSGQFFPSVIFKTPGAQTVTATDTVNGSITAGVSGKVTVTSPVASQLAIDTVPAETTVGYPMAIVVIARGSGGGTDINYRGTIDFSSATDSHAVLPATYTFTAADAGRHIFCPVPPWSTPNSPCVPSTPTTPAPDNVSFAGGASFTSAGTHTVTATDRAAKPISGTSGPLTVTSGTPTKFQVAGLTQVPAGSLFVLTVSALNAQDRATRGYLGTVHFTSTDSAAVLPPDHTFTAADAGTYQNVVVRFKTVGAQTVTVTDTANASIKGTSDPVTVTAATVTTTTTTGPGTTTTTTTPGSTTTTTVSPATTTTTRPSAVATASGPSTARRGEQVVLTGSGFPTGQQLRITMMSAATALGSIMSDATGAFRVSVTIPTDAELGAHRIVINTADGAHEAFIAFTVTATTLSAGASSLATTGSAPLGAIRFGCLLVAIGAVAVGAARSRRRLSRGEPDCSLWHS